jgi:hypothetical protein
VVKIPQKVLSDPKYYNYPSTAGMHDKNSKRRSVALGSDDSRFNMGKLSSGSDDEECIVYQGHPRRSNYTQTQWQFRRRDSSDRSSQPLGAPAGLHAQKADNFQKFYRAVVSPTHVRVTAGGRIVPNVRAPPQPVFVWNKDKICFDTSRKLNGSSSHESQFPGPHGVGIVLQQTDPNLQRTVSKTVSADAAGPTTVQRPHEGSKPQEPKVEGSLPNDQQHAVPSALDGNGLNVPPVKQEIRLSSPAQFDVTKPFIYNGRTIYPLPPGVQIAQGAAIPVGMLPGVTALQSPLQQHFFPQLGMPISAPTQTNGQMPDNQLSMNGPVQMFPMDTQGLMPLPVGIPPLIRHNSMGPPLLPIMGPQGAFSQAGLVRQQIAALEVQVQALNHQLEHNRHQIDETHVMAQRHYVQSQIQTLQASLALLPREPPSSQQSQSFPEASSSQVGATAILGGLHNWTGPEAIPPLTQSQEMKPDDLQRLAQSHRPDFTSSGLTDNGVNLPKPSVTPQLISLTHTVKPEPISRKRLSPSAAKAPPFQPRSQKAVAIPTKEKKNSSSTQNSETTQAILTARTAQYHIDHVVSNDTKTISTPVLTNGFQPNGHSLQVLPLSYENPPYFGFPKAHIMQSFNPHENFGQSASTFRTTYAVQPPHSIAGSVAGTDESGNGAPYLMGFIPPGNSYQKTTSTEFLYSRELNPEELKARQLYWGKAPREAMRGLPKFDGRDFYPPSPTKSVAIPTGPKADRHRFTDRSSNSMQNTSQDSGSRIVQSSQTSIKRGENSSKITISDPPSTGFCIKTDGVENPFGPTETVLVAKQNVQPADDLDETASTDSWGAPKFPIDGVDMFKSSPVSAMLKLGGKSKGKAIKIHSPK